MLSIRSEKKAGLVPVISLKSLEAGSSNHSGPWFHTPKWSKHPSRWQLGELDALCHALCYGTTLQPNNLSWTGESGRPGIQHADAKSSRVRIWPYADLEIPGPVCPANPAGVGGTCNPWHVLFGGHTTQASYLCCEWPAY